MNNNTTEISFYVVDQNEKPTVFYGWDGELPLSREDNNLGIISVRCGIKKTGDDPCERVYCITVKYSHGSDIRNIEKFISNFFNMQYDPTVKLV